MSLTPTVGHLKPTSDRATWWHEVFGSLDVPLRSPVPFKLDKASEDTYYEIDIERVTPEQFERLCLFVAEKFKADIDTVRAGITKGLPIRTSEIDGVAFDPRLVL